MYVLPEVPTIKYNGGTYYQLNGASHCYINTSGAVLSTGKRRPAFLTQQDNNGYKQVSVSLDTGGRGFFYVHRLVAQRFIPNPEGKPDVNHRNGNKADNEVSNLEWCTKSENTRHAYATGLMKTKRGAEHYLYGTHPSEATRAKQAEAKLGEKHPKFKGWYITPAGRFASAQAGADANGTYPKRVDRWCKGGKMKARGWDFEPVQQAPALAIAA